ncbi:MAG: BrnT family toxin [Terriglobales bacterium]
MTEDAVEFTWDERKNRVNQQKHGVSFETAILVFDDPYNLTRQDREVEGEPRWQTIGMVKGVHMLLVAHTVSEDEEVVHIISARKATRRERSIYAQSN